VPGLDHSGADFYLAVQKGQLGNLPGDLGRGIQGLLGKAVPVRGFWCFTILYRLE
jgi:hypothetical protein